MSHRKNTSIELLQPNRITENPFYVYWISAKNEIDRETARISGGGSDAADSESWYHPDIRSPLSADKVSTRLGHEGPGPDAGDDVVGHVEHLQGLVELEAVIDGGYPGPVIRIVIR